MANQQQKITNEVKRPVTHIPSAVHQSLSGSVSTPVYIYVRNAFAFFLSYPFFHLRKVNVLNTFKMKCHEQMEKIKNGKNVYPHKKLLKGH